MPVRKADAEWKGGLKNGEGNINVESGTFSSAYSFSTRFEDEKGTNPEELIGAAHAACFSMALSGVLEDNGYKPKRIATQANVTIEKAGEGFEISRIILDMEAEVPDIEERKFQELADAAKKNCPVSKALAGADIELKAKLK